MKTELNKGQNQEIKINKELCDLCGTCAGMCAQDAILIKFTEVTILGERCNNCFNCVKACPLNALTV